MTEPPHDAVRPALAAVLIAHRLLAPDATLAAMVETAAAMRASPVIAVTATGVDAPPGARVVRARSDAPDITAIRLGMAQLTNTMARVVLLWPHGGAPIGTADLHALVNETDRHGGSIIAFADTSLDRSPVLIPRDVWLELVTLGEGGLDALAQRRRVHLVAPTTTRD